MCETLPSASTSLTPHLQLTSLLDTLPDAVIFLNEKATIQYANASAARILEASIHELPGKALWQCASHIITTSFYQAVMTVIRTRKPLEVKYRCPVTRSWLRVHLSPTNDGVAVFFHEDTEPIQLQDAFHQSEQRYEEALRQSQEKMRTLMDSSIIGIAIAEGEEVVEANDTYLRMTGYSREDLSHRRINWVRMTPPEYMARTQQAHQEMAIHHYMTPYEKEYICKDGSHLPILAGGVILPLDPAQNIYFVLDNSVRKELEQRKDDLINMASHELRTPLTSVKIQVQLVRRRLVKQGLHEAAAALSGVEVPVKQLERLVGELLDVSKIQAGRLEYVQEPVDLQALLGEVAETMQQLSTTHAVVVRGTAPRTLMGDKGRLEQVFINLISNAIKYSPSGTTVEIDLSASTETVTVSVRDHGIGIAQEQREKIFERFYRVPDLSQGAIPGLGMGLYIVAEIVKHHGGTVKIESDVGHGSTFHVTLPLKSPITPRGDPAQGYCQLSYP